MNFVRALFDSSAFMPHGHCYFWTDGLIALHAISDALIVIAYYSIPVTLVYFVRKRRDLEFNWMFVCFAVFILACGTTHVMEIWNIWHANYWLSGSIKALTALASVPTAILLVKLVPQALALPSSTQLNRVNEALQREVAERKSAESRLREANEGLDRRVAERTQELARTNEALRGSQELLQAIIDNSPAVIYVKDLQGRYLLVNRRFEEIFRLKRADVLGKTDYDYFPKAGADAFRAMDERVVAAGHALTEEETAPQHDGPHAYISVKCPLRDSAGKIYAVFGISTDITERKQAEERFRLVVEASPNAMLMVDGRGQMTLVNRQTEQLFGYTRAELVGQPVEMLVPERYRGQHPGHRAGFFQQPAARAMGAGRDLFGRRKDGTEVPIEIGLNPIRTDEGNFVLASIIDITGRKQAQATLKESEERTPLILNSAMDAVITIDEQGAITGWNPQAVVTFGWTREEVMGKILKDTIIPPRYREAHERGLRRYLTTGVAAVLEKRIELNALHRDGREFPVELSITPIRLGDRVLFSAFVRDITDRKRAEEILRESQALYHSLVEQMPAGIFRKDPEGRYVFVNSWFCQFTGTKPEHYLGKTPEESVRAMAGLRSNFLDPDKVAELAAAGARHHVKIMQTGERIELDEERVFADGTKRYLQVVKAPVFDAEGKILGTQGMLIDITERKRAEELLRASEARLHLAQQVARVGTFEWNIQTGENHWMPELEAMYGLPPGGFAGTQQTWENLIHPEDRAETARRISRAMDSGLFEGEWRVIWPDGSLHWLAGRAWVFKDDAGKPLRLIGVNIDITERKKAEDEIHQLNTELEERVRKRTAELESVNKELEAFSYSVSHDLRAPLRAVNGFSGMVLEDYGGMLPEEGRRQLEKICRSGRHMGELIDDLLAFARLSRQPINRQPMNTKRLVQDVLEELNPQMQGRQIDVRVGELAKCQGDVALVRQVWVNLLSNAIKYTRGRAAAVVEIGCTKENGADTFFVRDNGTGFDMQYANKLFGVFQRLHRADEFEGTGVGLAIVQRIVHRHGGRVWAEAAPDRGATFYFTLENETKS